MADPYWSSVNALCIVDSGHAVYLTKQYAHCAALIRHIQQQSTNEGSVIPTYYRAQYMMLLAICEPVDKAARVTNFHARHTFQNAFPGLVTKETLTFFERLAFISKLVQVHLGGVEKSGQPIKYMDKNMEEWLRAKTLKELGLEVFMVHYALLADTRKKLESVPEYSKSHEDKLDKVGEQRKLKEMVAESRKAHEQRKNPEPKDKEEPESNDPTSPSPRTEQRDHVAKDTKRLSPNGTHTGASPSPKRPRTSVSEILSNRGTEHEDFSVKDPTSEAQEEDGSVPPSTQHRQDYTEALSSEELKEVEMRRNRLFADTTGPEGFLTPNDSRSPDDQQGEAPQEPQGDGDPIMEGIRSVLEVMDLKEV
ncbi:hypothetical protein DL98DRAFT_537914 [Cadophora sp. DSE1049]|nr:hypothetical protein DL98DRAFT_537914 [Cadophora sp. DSE1049]